MNQNLGWFERQRAGLWHLRKRGIQGYKQWLNRQSKPKAQRTIHNRELSPVTVEDLTVPVIAGVASIPSRTHMLRDAFNSIYWQVDHVYVFLNEFEEIPKFLELPRVSIFRSQDYQDFKDVGKFFALRDFSEGILFTIDDDILYPSDYVSRMLTYLASTDYRAAIGVHGFHLPRMPKSFFDRHMFHFRREVNSLAFASVLGTGTTAFDIARIGMKFDDFTSYGMADIHFAAYLRTNNIPALIVPREKEWLVPLVAEGDESPSLYELTQRHSAPHGKMLRSVAPWGEEYVVQTWSVHPYFQIDKNLKIALDMILLARKSKMEDVFHHVEHLDTTSFRQVLNWIKIYADFPTQHLILQQLVERNKKRVQLRDCLSFFWKLDPTKAYEHSSRLINTFPKDFQFLRQHALFSAGYFKPDEAEAYYLWAIRLAGAQGNKGTTSILFDYFKFLIRYKHYQKAYIVASNVKKKYGKTPYFVAAMVLCAVNMRQYDEARDWLEILVQGEDYTRRQEALEFLVRKLAECPIERIPHEQYLIGPVVIREIGDSSESLLAIVKIATMVGDRQGAIGAYQALESGHASYLEARPEIERYFDSNWNNEPRAGLKSYMGHREIIEQGKLAKKYDSKPLISVILTAYNSEETIGFAIESILNQTHANLELLVVDDCSQDNTAEIVQTYVTTDSRVFLIRNSENLGPYLSRNRALEEAKGAFVAIQDADDVSLPQRFELQLEKMTGDVLGVLGQHIRIDSSGSIHLENDGSILGHGPVTLMVRREVFDWIGYFSPVRTRGDKEFESRIEHRYGSHVLVRAEVCVVHALEDRRSNSWVQTSTPEKQRSLMLYKQKYSKLHARGEFSPVSMEQ